MWILSFISLAAQAGDPHASEDQAFVLEHGVDLFTDAEYDTDWMPADSAISVRFQIEASGGADVRMEGHGELGWPDALTLVHVGEPGTGTLAQDAALEAVTSVRFDVYGYEWESEIDRRGITVTAAGTFDPFLLDGADPDVATVDFEGADDELITYDYTVFTGVSLVFEASVHPASTTSFTGVSWQVGDAVDTAELAPFPVDVPPDEPVVDTTSVYTGSWSSELSLVITPSASVCVDVFGCVELASFDIPIALASDQVSEAFDPVELEFPLPVLVPEVDAYDFGPVEVGGLANLQLPLANEGALYLEGVTGVLGSDWFSVYPDYFYAAPGQEDGVVVTFAPGAEGDFEATIVFESNDPDDPVYEVTVTGQGVAAEEPDGPSDDGSTQVIESEVGGCGCAQGSTGRSSSAWLLLVGLLSLVRRRRC